jgi:hypothetical protein
VYEKLTKISEGIDLFFNKILPKKFIVFTVGTIALVADKITGEQWFYLSIAYLGGNVAAKIPQILGDKK